MALKLQKEKRPINAWVFLVVFIVISLAIMALYAREESDGILHSVQNGASGIVAPLKIVGAVGGSGADSVGEAVGNATASEDTYAEVKAQNQELREQLAMYEEYYQEAQRLEDLLGIRDVYGVETVGARVIGKIPNAWNQVITIDRGENDGVRSGLPVMSATGLIGQVISTTASTADVRLLTDPQSGASALIQSSRAEGIVRGSLEEMLYFEDFELDAQINVGDVVVTSGLGGGYYRGLIIGTVAKIEQKQGDASRKVIITPNAGVSSMEEVLVVVNMDSEGAASSLFNNAAAGVPTNTDTQTDEGATSAESNNAETDQSGSESQGEG